MFYEFTRNINYKPDFMYNYIYIEADNEAEACQIFINNIGHLPYGNLYDEESDLNYYIEEGEDLLTLSIFARSENMLLETLDEFLSRDDVIFIPKLSPEDIALGENLHQEVIYNEINLIEKAKEDFKPDGTPDTSDYIEGVYEGLSFALAVIKGEEYDR